jgi:hypothetical protein
MKAGASEAETLPAQCVLRAMVSNDFSADTYVSHRTW